MKNVMKMTLMMLNNVDGAHDADDDDVVRIS